METTMGRVTTEATIENQGDLWNVATGKLAEDAVRRITVSDALADTGATLLSLPTRLIQQLGLAKMGVRRTTSAAGVINASMYSAVRLTIQGRQCLLDVMEVPDSVPVLIGQIPLEHLDLVVNPSSRTLTGNPAHGGDLISELYYQAAG
jgi:predicted aspartyl protease